MHRDSIDSGVLKRNYSQSVLLFIYEISFFQAFLDRI